MRFGPVPVAEAGGAVLAHAVEVPGGRLRKGLLLGPADLARLEAAGVRHVTVARMEPGDVAEDAAAARIAAAVTGAGLRAGKAATGRVNLYATGPGVLAVDAQAVAALNAVHPMVTLATLEPWARLEAGGMAATVKIISYGVPEAAVAQAEAAGRGALALHPPVLRTACLIETEVPGKTHGPKGRAAMRGRLERLGVALAPRVTVPHEVAPLAAAITAAEADLVLILTASATSDPLDVAPAALVAAGGRVERFGMPVDPGNLLFLGDLRGVPVIGLPGCARSPALNGADWVLERVVCGVPVKGADIAAMGVGGLLKEIPSRPKPRDG